jgi:DNA polymerase-3 subunit delta
MEHQKPVIYLFHGDDLLSIKEAIANLKSRLGDQATAELNYVVLDGRVASIEQLETAGRSMPFLAERRMTVLNHPQAFMQHDESRQRVLALLEGIPDESAIILAEYKPLQTPKEKREGKIHWLQKWAASMGEKAFEREYSIPQLSGWIAKRARDLGGQFEPQAANRLAGMAGDDVQLVEQEIIKLLTYVNYERPVNEADVLALTAQQPEGFIFDFVDALGDRNRKKAINEFHRLLADSDIQSIFGMIVRQFRLLVQSREIIDQRMGEQEISKILRVHPFVGKKLAHQTRRFSQAQLDAIFHRLLEIDSGLKTGKMSTDLSVDLLIAEIT